MARRHRGESSQGLVPLHGLNDRCNPPAADLSRVDMIGTQPIA